MREITLPLTGGCQCGQVRYEITAAPVTHYCCHCTECQAQSASAFGISLIVDAEAIRLQGKTASYVRDKGKRTEIEGFFCPDCGTRFIHRSNAQPADVSIKGGSLDNPDQLTPVGHIWTKSKRDWLELPAGSLQYDTEPDDDFAALEEAFQAQHAFKA